MIPISFVEKYLQGCGMCKVSPKKFEEIMFRIKEFNPRATALSKTDLMVILEDAAFGLFDECKSDNSEHGVIVDIPMLKRTWNEKSIWPLRLFGGERQVMVVAQQIPNDTYPPQFAERVEIKIFENGKMIYTVQVNDMKMSLGYGSLALAVQSHEDSLGAIVYYGVKKILRNFYGHYFTDEDLKIVSSLEKFEKCK